VSVARWERLQELFHAAIQQAAPEREAFLVAACTGDPVLRAQVDRLLASHEQLGGIIERPALEASGLWQDEAEPSAVGRRFGAYRAVRELGWGGMGAVYLGERADGQFEQQAAIKVIKRGMDTAQVVARFRAERQILASLDHPNIARLLDGGTTEDGRPFFVMEYIDGQPMDVYADSHALTISQRLELFLQVAAAVSYAHQHLIVHRDIKPLNILVTADHVPKLLDFGIAKVLGPEPETPPVATETGWRVLTPEYASPEQVEGRQATTVSDVYSLGVVLYELLTGRSPYRVKNRTPQDVATAVCTTEPDRPSAAVSGGGPPASRRAGLATDRVAATSSGSADRLRRRLRGDLDTIVLTALRKEAQRRYQSVEQLAGDIRRHLDGRPVLARSDTFRYRAGKFMRRNRLPLLAATLVALTLVGGTVTTAWQARQARAAQARAERRFSDVRKLANSLLFDYHDAIKDLRGATPVRERLVRDALTYFDGLARERAGDPALQRELASAYRRVGDVQGGDPKGLGDTGGAVESYGKALRILEELYRGDSSDVQIRQDLASLTLALGSMVWERGDLAAGLAYARRARGLLERLLASSPDDTDQRLRLHAAYDLLGQMSLEAGEIGHALEFHRADLRKLERTPAAERRRPAVRQAISVSYGHLADAQVEAADLPGALAGHRESFALREGLAAEFPDNAEYDRLVGSARYYMADVLGRMGRWEEALELFRSNLTVEPNSGFYQFRVGEALASLGRHREALEYFRRALESHTKDLRADPGNLLHRLAIAGDRSWICKTLTALARPEAASACAETASFVEETSVEPDHAWPRAYFAASWFDLGQVYDSLAGRPATTAGQRRAHRLTALSMYRRSSDLWADLARRKLVSPTDTFRVSAAARAVERAKAAVGSRQAD
jgi:serine/threonine protein kinase/tetratricopeptide (TPR) repeat protein